MLGAGSGHFDDLDHPIAVSQALIGQAHPHQEGVFRGARGDIAGARLAGEHLNQGWFSAGLFSQRGGVEQILPFGVEAVEFQLVNTLLEALGAEPAAGVEQAAIGAYVASGAQM